LPIQADFIAACRDRAFSWDVNFEEDIHGENTLMLHNPDNFSLGNPSICIKQNTIVVKDKTSDVHVPKIKLEIDDRSKRPTDLIKSEEVKVRTVLPLASDFNLEAFPLAGLADLDHVEDLIKAEIIDSGILSFSKPTKKTDSSANIIPKESSHDSISFSG
jgi:hypothetical protein